MRRRLVPKLPRAAWIVLGGDALSALGSGMTLPFFVVYLHRVRGIDLAAAGLALSTVAFAGLLGNPLGGALADRFGSRRTLVAGLLVAAAGAGWLAFVSTVWEAFGAAAVVGLGAAVVWPAQDALLATAVRVEQRSSVFSVRHATLNLGFGVGALIAAGIVDLSSVRSFQVLYLIDALTFLAFVPLLLGLRQIGNRVPAQVDEARAGYRDVLRDSVFLRVWALTVLLVLVGYAQFHAAFPVFATGTGGLSAGALSLAFAVNTFVVAAAQLVVLALAGGRRRTTGILLVCLCWSAAWLVTVGAGQLDGGAVAVVVFAAAMGIFALGETLLSPTLPPLVNDLAPDRLRGRYNGLYTLGWTTGYIVGPALAGVGLGVGDGTPFFLALIGGCGIAAVGALHLRRRLAAAIDFIPRGGDPKLAQPEPA